MEDTSHGYCDSCKFWDRYPSSKSERGHCHRNAPAPFRAAQDEVIIHALATIAWATATSANIDDDDRQRDYDKIAPGTDKSDSYWPYTRWDDWCGEHVIKPAA